MNHPPAQLTTRACRRLRRYRPDALPGPQRYPRLIRAPPRNQPRITRLRASRERTMEPHQNVAIMQRAYEAFNTGDLNTLTELMDETVWHLPGRSSMAGDYQGSGATLAYFGQLAQETEGTFRAELQHMAADGDNRVVGVQRSTADRNGKHLDVANCIVFELKDGKVTDGREHFEDLYAWDEFWS